MARRDPTERALRSGDSDHGISTGAISASLVGISLIGWWLALGSRATSGPNCTSAAATWGAALEGHARAALWSEPPSAMASHWSAMVLAMVPMLIGRSLLSLSSRGGAATGILRFASGYTSVWIAAGPPMASAAVALRAVSETAGVAPIWPALAIGAAWQFAPPRRAALAFCRRATRVGLVEPRPFRQGASLGLACLCTCWALMAVPLAAHGQTSLMAGLMLFVLAEREFVRRGAARPDRASHP